MKRLTHEDHAYRINKYWASRGGKANAVVVRNGSYNEIASTLTGLEHDPTASESWTKAFDVSRQRKQRAS